MNSKNDIDELFRDGLNPEADPVAFDPAGWSKLNQRLNRHEKWKRTAFLLRTLGGIAAILLLFFSLWLIWPVKQKPQVQHAQVEHEDLKITDKTNEPSSPEGAKTESVSGRGSLIVSEPVREQPSKEAAAMSLTKRVTPAPDSLVSASQKIREALPASLPAPDRQITSHLDPIDTTGSATPSVRTVQVPPVEILHPVPAEPKHRRIAVSLLIAQAYNGVNNFNSGKTGSDAGLLFTVGLTKTLSFSTGAVYAKKRYEAGSADYHPPGNNGSGYKPQSVDADCRVLDLPLNLNYTFYNRGKSALSLGTGISSYIMLKENYRFIYANEDRNRDLELVNENRHWLSVLNLQASYERRLNPRLSISLQPYLKIPFTDIGYAKIKLQSFGMALSTTWNL